MRNCAETRAPACARWPPPAPPTRPASGAATPAGRSAPDTGRAGGGPVASASPATRAARRISVSSSAVSCWRRSGASALSGWVSLSASNSARIKSETSITAHDDNDSGATSGRYTPCAAPPRPTPPLLCSICGGNPHRAQGRRQPHHAGGRQPYWRRARISQLRPVVPMRWHPTSGGKCRRLTMTGLSAVGGRRGSGPHSVCLHGDNSCLLIEFQSRRQPG